MTAQELSFLSPASRRAVLVGATRIMAATVPGFPPLSGTAEAATAAARPGKKVTSDTLVTRDGARIYFNDWGSGQPVVFSHGWPLSSDAFEDQMFFMASNGYRAIAADRRRHGRSSQPWNGNDLDAFADDLARKLASS